MEIDNIYMESIFEHYNPQEDDYDIAANTVTSISYDTQDFIKKKDQKTHGLIRIHVFFQNEYGGYCPEGPGGHYELTLPAQDLLKAIQLLSENTARKTKAITEGRKDSEGLPRYSTLKRN